MLAEDVMNRGVITIRKGESLRKAISLMEENDIKELPVVEDSKLVGMITLYDFLYLGKISGKVENFMFFPPTVGPKDSISKVLDLILMSGVEAIPVVDKKRRVVGIISEYDILKSFKESLKFRKLRARDVMRKSITPVKPKDRIGKALRLMQFHRIDRLPVVDRSGKVIGIVLLIDILRILSLKEFTKLKFRADRLSEFEVKGILRRVPFQIRGGTRISEVIDFMLKHNLKGVCVLDREERPIGIVLRKDLLEMLKIRERLEVRFSGIKEIPLDLSEKVRNPLRKIKHLLPELEKLEINLKKIGKSKFQAKLHLKELGRTSIQVVGFSIEEVVREALEKLYELLRRRKE